MRRTKISFAREREISKILGTPRGFLVAQELLSPDEGNVAAQELDRSPGRPCLIEADSGDFRKYVDAPWWLADLVDNAGFLEVLRFDSRALEWGSDHQKTWTLDVNQKLLSRLGSPGGSYPAWSPDGRRLALVQDLTRLVVRHIDEESKPELWVGHDSNITTPSWTPDGRFLLYTKRDRQNYEVVEKSFDGDEKILLGEPFREISPRLTPNGHWLAYQSNENGRFEVFIRAFPSFLLNGLRHLGAETGPETTPSAR